MLHTKPSTAPFTSKQSTQHISKYTVSLDLLLLFLACSASSIIQGITIAAYACLPTKCCPDCHDTRPNSPSNLLIYCVVCTRLISIRRGNEIRYFHSNCQPTFVFFCFLLQAYALSQPHDSLSIPHDWSLGKKSIADLSNIATLFAHVNHMPCSLH